MSERQLKSDDIARAVFEAAKEAGEPVPTVQSARLIAEAKALTGTREIEGFAAAEVAAAGGHVLAVIGDEGHLLRWAEGELRVTFLGRLPGLRYEEHLKAIGGMPGYAGDPWVRLVLTHDRLPGQLTIHAEDWSVSLLDGIRATFRRWVAES